MSPRPADVTRFLDSLTTTLSGVFPEGHRLSVTRAPGRLDIMGGIADYSGSLVLEGTLKEAAVCGASARGDDLVVIRSLNAREEEWTEEVTFRLDDLRPGSDDDAYSGVRARLTSDRSAAWAAYVAGAFTALEAEGEVESFPHGATIVVQSDVPLGAGVSSSAALEVAAMSAVCATFGVKLTGMRLAALCQVVENRVVGAPCGIMDQVTSAVGREGTLLALKCQPHTLERPVALPPGVRVIGLDTSVKHSVGGSRYTETRVGAFMGQKIISETMTAGGMLPDPTGGYLCNLTPKEFVAAWRDLLPTQMKGSDFLDRYGDTNDPVTTVDPDTVYMVRSRTEHPIYENDRVRRFRELLRHAQAQADSHDVEADLVKAGKLMYGSNWSYGNRCGQASRETDFVVKMVKTLGPEQGFYGAKITGGGSGGTVAVMCREDTDELVETLATDYRTATGNEPRLFLETGPGALEFGVEEVWV